MLFKEKRMEKNGELFILSQVCYFVVYFPSGQHQSAKNGTWLSASIMKAICTNPIRVALSVVTFLWWRHKRLLIALWDPDIVIWAHEELYLTRD